jgi:hypothetical protein
MLAMIRVRRLTTRPELTAFRAAANRALGIEYPLDYFKRARVYGLCDDGGALLGGFGVDARGPFRSLMQIPVSERAKLSGAIHRLSRSAVEINGLWLSKSVRSPWAIAAFWLRLLWEIWRTGRRYIVYSYVINDRRMKRLWTPLASQVVYRGWVVQLPGMTEPERESIECASALGIVLTPLLRPRWFARRVLGRVFARRSAQPRPRTLSLEESSRVGAVR